MRKARYIVVSVLMAFFAMIAKAEDSVETDTAGVENGEEEEGSGDPEWDRLQKEHNANYGTIEGIRIADEMIEYSRKRQDLLGIQSGMQCKLTDHHSISDYAGVNALADSLIDFCSEHDKYVEGKYFAMYIKVISYIEQGRYKAAIQISQSLYDASREKIIGNDSIDITKKVRCNALTGLGLANSEMGRDEAAIAYYQEGIDLIEPVRDSIAFAGSYLDLQTFKMTSAQKLPVREKALKYFEEYQETLEWFNRIMADYPIPDNEIMLETAYVDVYSDLSNLKKARVHIAKADSILAENPELADQYAAELHSVKAKYYNLMGNGQLAIAHADSASAFYKTVGKLSEQVTMLKLKHNSIHKLGQYNLEYPIANSIFSLMDTIYIHRYNSQVEDMQTVMNMDKLEQKTHEQEAELKLKEANEARLQARNQMLALGFVVVLLVGTVAVFIYKRRRDMEKQKILSEQKEKLQQEVDRQTEQLREQRDEIARKNRDITDSINYALRIQQSILPNLDSFNGYGTGGAFAFYVPCHIVSGDFYWSAENEDIKMFACADCTGHGVPGAFMSMIGTTILNDLFSDGLLDPAEILERLHERLISILQQNGEGDSRDGMDVGLLVFDRKKRTASAASARRPVYFYKGGEMVSFKGTKRSIGERDYDRNNMPFESYTEIVSEGDTVYMSSDGMPDQFGGPTEKGKRLKNSGMEAMMDKIVQLPITQQEKAVHDFYYEWRNTKEQLDDISFMGIRF